MARFLLRIIAEISREATKTYRKDKGEKMRKQFKVVMMVICLLFLSVNMGWAGRGTGTGGQGNGGGTGPIHDILGERPLRLRVVSLVCSQVRG